MCQLWKYENSVYRISWAKEKKANTTGQFINTLRVLTSVFITFCRTSQANMQDKCEIKFLNIIFQKEYDFSKYMYADDLTSSQEAEMLTAIQGTRSAEFEPENCMSPKAEAPVAKPPQLVKPDVLVDCSPSKAEQNDTVAPLGSKVSSQIQMGLHGVGTSRDSPTFISDDDTSYSTWKPVSDFQFFRTFRTIQSEKTLSVVSWFLL